MTAWGVVAVCGVGGGAAGPFLDAFARRFRRPPVPPSTAAAPEPAPVDASGGTARLAVPADAAVVDAVTPPLTTTRAVGSAVTAGTTRPRAPVVLESVATAVVTAAAFFLAAVRLGDVPQLAAYCVLAAALVVVSITDLRTGLVPRRIVYGAALVVGLALVAASATDDAWRPMLDALVGGAIGFFVLGAVWWISPKAMGFGDVRLAGLCGAALGWLGMAALYLGFVAAFVSGTIFGLGVLLAHGRRRFPFAPALGFGTMFGVLWGVWLGGLWLHFR